MTTANINLLPWREERRDQKEKQFLVGIAIAWAIAAVVAYGMVNYWNSKIDNQKSRNKYLSSEISKLTRTIKEIDTLKQKRNAIVDRMEVIQELQTDRAQIVHVFDDLVYKMPEGVYLQSLTKQGSQISMRGFAQANARVSTLMRNLDSSAWFRSPTLKVVKNKENNGLDLSEFNIQVREQRKRR